MAVWHTQDLTALTGASDAIGGSALTSYVWADQKTLGVFYISTDGLIHDVSWDEKDGWDAEDPTKGIGAPTAIGDSALTSYIWPDQKTQHVFYLSENGHVHELAWDDPKGWQTTDITASTKAPAAVGDSALTSYVWADQKTQHVFYLSNDGHVHELWWEAGKVWKTQDLTAAAEAPSAVRGSALTGYVWPDRETQHIFYLANDGHVQTISWNEEDGWDTKDLTDAARAPIAVRGSALVSYVWEEQKTQGVLYLSSDGHIHDLSWDKKDGWGAEDPIALTNAPAAVGGSALTCYVWNDQRTQHVFYLSANDHVHQLSWDEQHGWRHVGDLTAMTGAPKAVRGSALSGFVWSDHRTLHVFYLSEDDHIHEFWWG